MGLIPASTSARLVQRSLLQPTLVRPSPADFGGATVWLARGSWTYLLFTHRVISGSSHTPALGISSPGIDKAHLMGPCNHGETQWNTTLDWTYRGGQDNGVPAEQRKPTSLPGRWRWCDRSWPCDARQSKTRASHIDPPTCLLLLLSQLCQQCPLNGAVSPA